LLRNKFALLRTSASSIVCFMFDDSHESSSPSSSSSSSSWLASCSPSAAGKSYSKSKPSEVTHLQNPQSVEIRLSPSIATINAPPQIGKQSTVISVSLCVTVCACVYLSMNLSREPHVRSSPNSLCMLSMDMARTSSGGVVIRYVFPVLWTTSYLHIS